MYLILFTVAILLLLFYTILLNRNRPKDFPPGPSILPFFGNYLHVLLEDNKYSHFALAKLAKKYNTKILGFYLGDIPAICTMDWQLTKEAITKDEFYGKGFPILNQARSQGQKIGIFNTDGPFWLEQRRFTLRNMRDFGFGRRLDTFEQAMSEQVKELFELLQNEPKKCDADVHRAVGEVLSPEIFYGYYMNCVWYILSGSFHNQRKLREVCRYAMGFQRCTDVLGGIVTFAPWIRYFAPKLSGYQAAVDDNYQMFLYCQDFVKEHLATYQEGHIRDFIDSYIMKIKTMESDDNIDIELYYKHLTFVVLDYMFPAGVAAGHTTNFILGRLINHSNVLKKMQMQIDEVVGRSRFPTIDDRINLPYVDAVIQETMRIDPANPLLLGRLSTEDTTLGGYFIPKGTYLAPNIWWAHNDPEIWGDPENFRPERWLNEDGSLIRKDLTMSFGGGKRVCAGETFARQMIFLFLSMLVQQFDISQCDNKGQINMKDVIPGINMSLRNFWLKATVRI